MEQIPGQSRAEPRFYAKNGHLPGEEAFRQTSADVSDGAADVSDGAAGVSDGAAEASGSAAGVSDGAAGVSDGAAEASGSAAGVSGMAAEPGDAAGDCLRGLICPIFFCCTPCRANQELYGTLAVLSNKSVTLKAA